MERYLRVLVGLLLLAVTAYFSLLFAFGLGYVADPGVERLREMMPGLLVSVAIATAGVATALILFRKRALSPWLLCALIPAALASASHLGIG